MTKHRIGIAIHGGAGTILKAEMSPEKEANYKQALDNAISPAYELLAQGGSALDAVELAVQLLEDSPLFNAGKGAVFNALGAHDMDASIMDGKTREAGAVCQISKLKNPIKLARLVMDKSEHVFLSGSGAEVFAEQHGAAFESPEYFYDELRFQQWQSVKGTNKTQLDHSPLDEKKFGTVGAVALDAEGNLAAATSTGGMTNKQYGRIGDSPMIGAGTYADNKTCAVSCTGSGEYFIRHVSAYRVSVLMELKGLSLEDACKQAVMEELPAINGDGGLIAIDKDGNICLPFNTEGMYRAAISSAPSQKEGKEEKLIAIYGS